MTKRRVKKAEDKFIVGQAVTVKEHVALAKRHGLTLSFWRPGYR